MKKNYNVIIEKKELKALIESQNDILKKEKKEMETRKAKQKTKLEKIKKGKTEKKEKVLELYDINKKSEDDEIQEITFLHNQNKKALEEISQQLDNELTSNDYISNIYSILIKYLIDNDIPQSKENLEKNVINALFTNNLSYVDNIIKKVIFIYYGTYSNSLIEWQEIKNQVYLDLLERKKASAIEFTYYNVKYYTMTACRNLISNAKTKKLTYKEDIQFMDFINYTTMDFMNEWSDNSGDINAKNVINELIELLTDRQKNILAYRLKEYSNREIATRINVSRETVNRELKKIQVKFSEIF